MADLIRRPYLSSVVKAIRGPEAGSDPRNTIPIVGFPKPMASILPDAELTALSFADGANGLDFPSKGSVTVIVLHGGLSPDRDPAPPASWPLRGFGGDGGDHRHQPNGGFRETDR